MRPQCEFSAADLTSLLRQTYCARELKYTGITNSMLMLKIIVQYVRTSDRIAMLSIDEKIQNQALNRTQTILRLKTGIAAR